MALYELKTLDQREDARNRLLSCIALASASARRADQLAFQSVPDGKLANEVHIYNAIKHYEATIQLLFNCRQLKRSNSVQLAEFADEDTDRLYQLKDVLFFQRSMDTSTEKVAEAKKLVKTVVTLGTHCDRIHMCQSVERELTRIRQARHTLFWWAQYAYQQTMDGDDDEWVSGDPLTVCIGGRVCILKTRKDKIDYATTAIRRALDEVNAASASVQREAARVLRTFSRLRTSKHSDTKRLALVHLDSMKLVRSGEARENHRNVMSRRNARFLRWEKKSRK